MQTGWNNQTGIFYFPTRLDLLQPSFHLIGDFRSGYDTQAG